MILKKANGDKHKFCTALMEKTVGGIGILNSDLFSDQFFLQCILKCYILLSAIFSHYIREYQYMCHICNI